MTSYEYDVGHQLTAMLWLKDANSLAEFREGFIGWTHKKDIDHNGIKGELEKKTIEALAWKLNKESLGAKDDFFEMQGCFEEMNRSFDG